MKSLVINEGDEDPVEGAMSSIASSVLERARGQDQESWQLLVEFHAPLVYMWCRMKGLDAETARDVGQEVFAAVVRRIDKFDRNGPRGTFRGWIRTITENKIRDYWRKKNSQHHAAGGSEAFEALREFPEPDYSKLDDITADKGFLIRVLNYAKEHIKPAHWEVFWQIAVEEKSAAEVADLNGFERAHVYVIKSRVLRQLRKMFLESNERM